MEHSGPSYSAKDRRAIREGPKAKENKEIQMSPIQITTEPTIKAWRLQSYYDSKARQARSDFLASTFHALGSSILEAFAKPNAVVRDR